MKEIIEVVELTRPDHVNQYLEAGYQLLLCTGSAWAKTFEGGTPDRWYVRKAIRYAVGRPEGVERIEPD